VHEPEKESGLYAKAGEHIIDLNHDKSESSSQYNSWMAANRDNVIDEKNAAANDKVLKAENRWKVLIKVLTNYALKSK
jgi:hypothetical protein